MSNIQFETASKIAMAYRDVEVAEKLLADICKALDQRETPDFRDAFGRRAGGLQLGVPSGDTSQRLFNVDWNLARPIIEAHIANQKAIIAALSEKARTELAGASTNPEKDSGDDQETE